MRTVGSLGKAQFLMVSISEIKEALGLTDNGKILISAKDYAHLFGIDRNKAPRTKILKLGAETLPAADYQSLAEAAVSFRHEEKVLPAKRVDFSEFA